MCVCVYCSEHLVFGRRAPGKTRVTDENHAPARHQHHTHPAVPSCASHCYCTSYPTPHHRARRRTGGQHSDSWCTQTRHAALSTADGQGSRPYFTSFKPMDFAEPQRDRTMLSVGSTARLGSCFCFDTAISYSARSDTVPTVSLPGIFAPFARPVTRLRYHDVGGGKTSNENERSSNACNDPHESHEPV